LTVWAAGELAGLVTHGHWPPTGPSDAGRVLVLLLAHPARPGLAWPLPVRTMIPKAGVYYPVLAAISVLGTGLVWVIVAALHHSFASCQPVGRRRRRERRRWPARRRQERRRWPARRRRARAFSVGREGGRASRIGWLPERSRGLAARGSTWARSRDLRTLEVGTPPCPGRLTLGRSGRRYLATEARHSAIIVGPTQTFKTSGFAVPAILEWEGPVLATSVKADLVRDTLGWRESVGQVWLYDPTTSTGLPSAGWSPLASSLSWAGARRMSAALCSAARTNGEGLGEADFWYATASKLLAPLLFAAACSGRTMVDVVRWVDQQEVDEVDAILQALGAAEAMQAAHASWRREDRQRSSVYTTAETILEAFADPAVASSSARSDIDPGRLLDGGARTLFVCAPAHEQRRLRPVFSALVSQVLLAAYERATLRGMPLDPPLLVVLDEAANIAPLSELDTIAATAASHGIQLVTIWQDMAQVAARYGTRAATVVNNHRAKVVLSGISDPATLEHVSLLIGDEEVPHSSTTTDPDGRRSTTASVGPQRLAPADALRRIRPGEGVLIYGHLPPARLSLRPWFDDRQLTRRSEGRQGSCETF
jgi:type IV secretion system protein VirD4